MHKVLMMCSEDKASVNIRNMLIETGAFEKVSLFRGRPVHLGAGLYLFEIDGVHLYLDDIDTEIGSFLDREFQDDAGPTNGPPLELLVFLSKHRSDKGTDSLTVHPPGNFLSADYGGRERFLPPSAPHHMSAALRSLYNVKKSMGLKDRTSYEVTHHGPVVSSPCFFIEIGSGSSRWEIREPGEAVARSILSDEFTKPVTDLPVAIGIGGGHYAPRFTDMALKKRFSFGHMISDHVLSKGEDIAKLLRLAKGSTPRARYIALHITGRNRELLEGLEEAASELYLEIT